MAASRSKVSLSETLAQISAEIEPLNLDDVQRLRDKGFINFKGQSITSEDAERLHQIAVVRKALGKGWTFEKLAFVLALHAVKDLPLALVGAYLEEGVQAFLSYQNRVLSRQASGRAFRKRKLSRAQAMAAVTVRKYRRDMQLPKGVPKVDVAMDAMFEWLTVICGVIYFDEDIAGHAATIRRAVYLSSDNNDDDSVAEATRIIRETAPWFQSRFETNSLLSLICERRATRSLAIMQACRDAGLLLQLGNYVLSDIPDPDLSGMSKTHRKELDRVLLGPYGAILTAVVLQLNAQHGGNRILETIRNGKPKRWREQLNQLFQDAIKQQQEYSKLQK